MASPINLNHMKQYMLVSDKQGFVRLKNIFIRLVPSEMKNIKKAIKAQDKQKLGELAHQMKGTSMTMGATQLSDLFKTLENMAQNGQMKRALSMVGSIDVEFKRVKKFLNQKNLFLDL